MFILCSHFGFWVSWKNSCKSSLISFTCTEDIQAAYRNPFHSKSDSPGQWALLFMLYREKKALHSVQVMWPSLTLWPSTFPRVSSVQLCCLTHGRSEQLIPVSDHTWFSVRRKQGGCVKDRDGFLLPRGNPRGQKAWLINSTSLSRFPQVNKSQLFFFFFMWSTLFHVMMEEMECRRTSSSFSVMCLLTWGWRWEEIVH